MNMTRANFRMYSEWVRAALRGGYEVTDSVAKTATGRVMGRYGTRGGYLKTFN